MTDPTCATLFLEARQRCQPADACGGQSSRKSVRRISFGQPMPVESDARAAPASRECDLFIVFGSARALAIPAAGTPMFRKVERCRSSRLSNRETTDMMAGRISSCPHLNGAVA